MLYMYRYTIWAIVFICYVVLYNNSSCPMKAALQWKMRSIHHWCAKNCRALKAQIPHPCSLLWSHIWIFNIHTIRELPLLFLCIFNYKSGYNPGYRHCLSLQVESWAWWWNKWLVLLSNGAWKNRLQKFHQQVKGSEMHYLELLWRRTESLRRIISVSWWGLQIAWSWKRFHSGPPFFSASLSEPTSGKYWKIALAMCPLSSTPMPSTKKTFDFEKNVRRICWTRRIPSARFAWKIFNLAPGPHGHTAMIWCWKLASRFIDVVW